MTKGQTINIASPWRRGDHEMHTHPFFLDSWKKQKKDYLLKYNWGDNRTYHAVGFTSTEKWDCRVHQNGGGGRPHSEIIYNKGTGKATFRVWCWLPLNSSKYRFVMNGVHIKNLSNGGNGLSWAAEIDAKTMIKILGNSMTSVSLSRQLRDNEIMVDNEDYEQFVVEDKIPDPEPEPEPLLEPELEMVDIHTQEEEKQNIVITKSAADIVEMIRRALPNSVLFGNSISDKNIHAVTKKRLFQMLQSDQTDKREYVADQ